MASSSILIVNERGELLAFRLTPGHIDDREPAPELTAGLSGKLIGDRGYISQKLFHELWKRGLRLVTKIRKNMHNKLMPMVDKLLLRKRAIIETINETINDQIKNIQQIEHTRHRSVVNAMVNVLAALVAYTHQPCKPSLNLSQHELNLLTFNE